MSEILETSFIDRIIEEIFPAEQKIVPNRSRSVEILETTTFEDKTTAIMDENTVSKVGEKKNI